MNLAYITHSEMLHYIRGYVTKFATQKEAAKNIGVSEQFLSDVLKGRREISERLASKLGFRRTVRFCKK